MYTKEEKDAIVNVLQKNASVVGQFVTPNRLALLTGTSRSIVNAVLFTEGKKDPKIQYMYRSPYNVKKYKRPAWTYTNLPVGQTESNVEKHVSFEDLVSSLPDTLE